MSGGSIIVLEVDIKGSFVFSGYQSSTKMIRTNFYESVNQTRYYYTQFLYSLYVISNIVFKEKSV